jgi:rubrerythrin
MTQALAALEGANQEQNMESSAKRLAKALLNAVKAEGDGYHFYLMAARSTDDPKGKEVFEMLAREELDHQQYLRAQYQSIRESGHYCPNVKLPVRAVLSGESPIFSAELKKRIGEAHFEMSALSIGLQLELSSMNYYKDTAGQTDDPAVKAFLEELAQWEASHYQALLKQQELLKESYWSERGFAPF